MKTAKEIQLAALTFSHAFKSNQASDLEGTFIPFSPAHLYKEHQFYLGTSILFGILSCYLAYNAWFMDAVYYWHIDGPVIIGVSLIALFFIVFGFLVNRYIQIGTYLERFLEKPNESPYGIIITEDYYYEYNPRESHIISRENIVHIAHQEEKRNKEIYLELLIEMGTHQEVRGLTYKKSDFDFQSWINQKE